MARRSLLLALLLVGCAPTPGAPGASTVETVGALVDLSGPAAQAGAGVKGGLELALEDVNAYLDGKHAGFRLALQTADPGAAPLAAYQTLKAAGVHAIVGPVTSQAAEALAGPATADGIVLVSPSSTASSLAKDDNLLRFAPVDVLQGVAIARAMAERGAKAELVLARDDVYGRGLAQEVEYAAGLAGVTHAGTIPYAPDAATHPEAIAALKAKLAEAEGRYGAGNVAVELVSYDEAGAVMAEAKAAGGLDKARWFGCDGNARTASVTANAEAAAFAQATRFLASTFVIPAEAGLAVEVEPYLPQPSALALRAKPGTPLNTFFYAAYDALWNLALEREAQGGLGDASKLKAGLYARSQTFKGESGVPALNAQGDRATGQFGFFSPGAGTGPWTLEAVYGNDAYQRLN